MLHTKLPNTYVHIIIDYIINVFVLLLMECTIGSDINRGIQPTGNAATLESSCPGALPDGKKKVLKESKILNIVFIVS